MTCPFPGELAGRQADGFALSSLLNWDPAMSTTTFTLSHIKLEFSSHPPSLKAYVFVCFVVTKILASFFFLFFFCQRHWDSMRLPKLRSWQRWSQHIREQRTRLYIIWKCTVILLSWDGQH
jgi:hypothetical protein